MIKRKDGFSGERVLVLPQPIIREMEEDPISSILHITDIGYYPKAWHHFRERQEPITQFVFIYCIEGSGWYRTEGEEFQVTANQYFILPAGKPHAYGANEEDPWTIYWIHFKGKLASHFARQCTRPVEIKPGMHSRISNRIDMFEEILRTLEMGYSHENLLYACSIFYHYLGTLRYLQQYRDAARHENGKERYRNGCHPFHEGEHREKADVAGNRRPYGLFLLPLLRPVQPADRLRTTDLLQPVKDTAGLPALRLYGHEGEPGLL